MYLKRIHPIIKHQYLQSLEASPNGTWECKLYFLPYLFYNVLQGSCHQCQLEQLLISYPYLLQKLYLLILVDISKFHHLCFRYHRRTFELLQQDTLYLKFHPLISSCLLHLQCTENLLQKRYRQHQIIYMLAFLANLIQ